MKPSLVKPFVASLLGLGLVLALFVPISRADDPDFSGPSSFVRVLHGLSLGQKVDVYIDGSKKLNDVEFSALSKYLRVPSGKRSIRIVTNDPPHTLVATSRVFARDSFYTFGIYGVPRSLHVLAANDSLSKPSYGNAHLRVYHLSPGMPSFDVVGYIRGGDIIPLVRNVRYGTSRAASIPAIPMTVRLVRNGRILKTVTGVDPRAGRKYAAYAIGRPARNFRLLLDVTASQ
jgi:hypothetical protein